MSVLLISLIISSSSMSVLTCWPPRPQVRLTYPETLYRHFLQRQSNISLISSSQRSLCGASMSFFVFIIVFETPVPLIDTYLSFEEPNVSPILDPFLLICFLAIATSNQSLAVFIQLPQNESTEWQLTVGPQREKRSRRPVEFECSRFGGNMNFKILSMETLVLMYQNTGGFSGIGSKNTSLSLLAALASSLPQNPFLIVSLPYSPLNL